MPVIRQSSQQQSDLLCGWEEPLAAGLGRADAQTSGMLILSRKGLRSQPHRTGIVTRQVTPDPVSTQNRHFSALANAGQDSKHLGKASIELM